MLKTVVLMGNATDAQFWIPGFVKIDDVRQIGDLTAEYDVVYDESKLHEVSMVLVGNAGENPPQNTTDPFYPLPKVRMFGDRWMYTYYQYWPIPSNWGGEKTMVFVGRAYRMQFYVPGLVAIEKMRATGKGDGEMVEVYVRASGDKKAEIHKVSLTCTAPDKEIPAGAIDLGLIHPLGLWGYVYATDEILPAA